MAKKNNTVAPAAAEGSVVEMPVEGANGKRTRKVVPWKQGLTPEEIALAEGLIEKGRQRIEGEEKAKEAQAAKDKVMAFLNAESTTQKDLIHLSKRIDFINGMKDGSIRTPGRQAGSKKDQTQTQPQ